MKNTINNSIRILAAIILLTLIVLPAVKAQQRMTPNTRLNQLIKSSESDMLRYRDDLNLKHEVFFTQYRSAFGLSDEDEMRIFGIDTCSIGDIHYKYQQYYKGIPVYNASYIFHEHNNRIKVSNGTIINGLNLDVTPGLSEAAALQYSLGHVNAITYMWELPGAELWIKENQDDNNASFSPTASLLIIENKTILRKPKYLLAWKFIITAADPFSSEVIFVDANDGQLISRETLIVNDEDGKALTPYYGERNIKTLKHTDGRFMLFESGRGKGIRTYDANNKNIVSVISDTTHRDTLFDNNNRWGEAAEVNAQMDHYASQVHWGMERAWDYFKTVHGRKSTNNNNIRIVSYVHERYADNNAFHWGTYNIYGFGDIYNAGVKTKLMSNIMTVGHEFTHGVTFYSVKNLSPGSNSLVYRNESGAINEAMSDIFAACIDYRNFGADSMWLYSHDRYRDVAGKNCTRNIKNPNLTSQPDTYYKVGGPLPRPAHWVQRVPAGSNINDRGGVHTNNSIGSHWFYLVCEGGAGTDDLNNNFNVEGIGVSKAEKIAYRALTVYFNNVNLTYPMMRTHTIQAAEDLFCQVKAVDPCCNEKQQVINAWYAVGVGDSTIMIDTAWADSTQCDSAQGTVNVRVVGVTGTPKYRWNTPNNDTTSSVDKLEAGTYAVTITDTSTNCSIDTNLTVHEKVNFSYNLGVVDPLSCKSNDGSVYVKDVEGITGTPEYLWSTGGTEWDIEDLGEGSYSVTVTDTSTGCDLAKDTTIKALLGPKISISGGGNRTFCKKDNPKEVVLTVVPELCYGGCTYKWDNNTTGASYTVTKSGTYTVTATDSDTCTTTASAQVNLWIRDCDSTDQWEVPIIRSSDPNDIAGPTGYGPEKFINTNDKIPYLIRFENDPDFATASAQKVIVTVPIHPITEMFTLELGDFGFGDFVFNIPPNTPFYSNRLDVVDSLGVYVDIIAGIDVTKNEIFWIFQSIDPVTGLEPSDPTLGFLLINDSITHRGEGFVNFAISPVATAQTGDTVSKQAAIVFDINETIPTNVYTNTFDAVSPSSELDSLPPDADNTSIHLSYSAQDDVDGSGVGSLEIWYSQENGPFQIFGTFNADTNIYFTGLADVTYELFSIAIDNVGNKEAMKTQPEATVTLHDEPFYRFDLDGMVFYDNDLQTPMTDVRILLEDEEFSIDDSTLSDGAGLYSFNAVDIGNYKLLSSSTKLWGGGNAVDALLIARYFVGLQGLSSHRAEAADVNNDGTANAADAQMVVARFVNLLSSFPAGEWYFQQDPIPLTDSNLTYDYLSLCYGDVNGSHIPGNKNLEKSVFLEVNDEMFITENTIQTIPLSVKREIITGAISLVIHYPEHTINIMDVRIPGKEIVYFTARDGQLRIAWYGLDPLHLQNGDIMLNIDIKINDYEAMNRINFTLATESQVADAEAGVYSYLEISMPKLLTNISEGYLLEDNIPNPFNNTTEIPFSIPERSYVKLAVYNILGELVEILKEGQMEAGRHSVIFDRGTHNAGIYFYRLEASSDNENYSETKRMIIARK